MDNKTKQAMQMALEALDHVRFYGTHKFPAAMEALREALNTRSSSTHSDAEYSEVAQPQDMKECRHCGWLCKPNDAPSKKGYVLTQPQGEPVAWMYKFKTEDPILCKVKRDWADNHSQWKETPLYTTPPSVEAAIEAALLKQQELWIQATEDGIESAIEATKEKAAKVCEDYAEKCVEVENWEAEDVALHLDAAIRSMK